MKISCQFGEANWSSFLLRAITSGKSLYGVTGLRMLNESIHRIHICGALLYVNEPVSDLERKDPRPC